MIEKSRNNPFMRDLFTEATPFEIENGKIIYYPHFKEPELYRTANKFVEDNNKLLNLVTN